MFTTMAHRLASHLFEIGGHCILIRLMIAGMLMRRSRLILRPEVKRVLRYKQVVFHVALAGHLHGSFIIVDYLDLVSFID